MKKILFYFGAFAVLTLFFASCGKDPSFDESLLIGKWRVGTTQEFYRFNANHTGVNWDESDDVSEEEGTKFNWSLKSADLHFGFIEPMTGVVIPEIYTVTVLTSTTLTLRDDIGRRTSFTKVN